MPYEYEHEEITLLDATQRGLLNMLFQSTWGAQPQNVTGATIRDQAGTIKVVEVTGLKVIHNEAQLPDPPFDVVSTDGSSFTIQLTKRAQLNAGQITQLNNFIASVWPGAVTDVRQLEFFLVDGNMRVHLLGELSAATAGELPKGKRFRVKTKS